MKEMRTEEVKRIALDMLSFIDKVCRNNNIRYFLCAGTLLGAVRHKGFIPWDDDIDIMLPRKDFERLIQMWPANNYYDLLSPKKTKNFPYAFCKIIDNRTYKYEPIRAKYQIIGVDVDVFPLDNFPDDENESLNYLSKIKEQQKLLNNHLSIFYKSSNPLKTIARTLNLTTARFCERLGFNTVDRIIKDYTILSQKYNSETTNHIGITSLYHYGMGERYEKSWFEESTNTIFEGKMFPAPIGYKEYLRHMYGEDYMRLPPIEKRVTHHVYKAYWKE